jgi:hypothetical protein
LILIIGAFKAFLDYYNLKINSEIQKKMTAEEMIEITLKHILPPNSNEKKGAFNVSDLEGIERLNIPHEDQGRLFLHFFSKALLDRNLQEVVSTAYGEDIHGISKIFEYGNMSGHMRVDDSKSAAYG